MKIEKLNENQIRCTLTHADLAARHLKLSELAYGTEKAKSLFRDMMQQASFDFGFEAENIPLMIEAIPSSADSIVLIITKVEDPEELDTRFSKFTPADNSDPLNSETLEKLQGAEEFLNLLNKVKEAAAATSAPVEEPRQTDSFSIRLFSFSSLDGVIEAAKLIAPAYHGANTLYKDESAETFILALAPVEMNLTRSAICFPNTDRRKKPTLPCLHFLKNIARFSYRQMQYVNYPHYKLVCGQRISKEKGRRFNDQSNRKAPTLLRNSYLPIAFAAALIFSTRSPQSIP